MSDRSQRIAGAIKTSLLSKGSTLLVQLIALPLVARTIGPEMFGVYAALAAISSWFSSADLGIGPSVGHRLAEGVVRDDRRLQGRYFTAALVLMALAGMIVLAAGIIAALSGKVVPLFGAGFAAHENELASGFMLVIALVALQLVTSLGGKARAGFQELHLNNLYGMAGNLVMAAALVAVAWIHPTVFWLLFVVFGSGVLVNGLNLAALLRGRPYLWCGLDAGFGGRVRELLVDGLVYAVAIGLLGIQREVGRVMLGHTVGPVEVGRFTILTALMTLLGGVVVMVTAPLWPAIADARLRGDHEWLGAAWKRLQRLSLGFGLVAWIAIGLAGAAVVRALYGAAFAIPPAWLWLTGAYFFATVIGHARFVWLLGCKTGKLLAAVAIAEFLSNQICFAVVGERLAVESLLWILAANHFVFSVTIQDFAIRRLGLGAREMR